MSLNVEIARRTDTPRMTSTGARNRSRRPTTTMYPVNADRPKTRFECRRSMQNCNGAQSASRFRAASTTTLSRHRTDALLENRLTRLGVCRRSGAGLPESLDTALVLISYDRRGGGAEADCDHFRRPWPDFRGETPSPRLRPDPGDAASEGPTRLHVERLVAHHPRGPGADSEVPRGREQHPGPRLPARAIRQHVVRAMVDLGNPDVILPEGRKHAVVDPHELPLRDQLPSGGVLVRHDHQAPAVLLEEAHARNRTGQELEMFGRADVSSSSAIDHAVTVEEDRRLIDALRAFGQSMTLHAQCPSRLGGLQEEIHEPPLRERVAGQRESLINREPSRVLNLVRFESKSVGPEMALVHEAQRVRRFSRKTRDVDIEETVERDLGPNLLHRFPLRSGLRPLPVVHEAAGDVPVPFRIPSNRLHHQHTRSLRQDDFGDATDHRRVDGALYERVDVRPFEHGVPSHPLFRVMVEPRGALQHTILAEVHDAVRIRPEWKALVGPRESVLAAFPDEEDLTVRLDEHVPAAPLLGHSSQPCPWAVLNAHGERGRSVKLSHELSTRSRPRRGAARSSRSSAGLSPTSRCRSGSPPSPRTGLCGLRLHAKGRCP